MVEPTQLGVFAQVGSEQDSKPEAWWDQVAKAFDGIIHAGATSADPVVVAAGQTAAGNRTACQQRKEDIDHLKFTDAGLRKRIDVIGDIWLKSHLNAVKHGASDQELLAYYGEYKLLIHAFEEEILKVNVELDQLQADQAKDCVYQMQVLRHANGTWTSLRDALATTAPQFKSYPLESRKKLVVRQTRLRPRGVHLAGRYNDALGFERRKTGMVRAFASVKEVDWLPDPPKR